MAYLFTNTDNHLHKTRLGAQIRKLVYFDRQILVMFRTLFKQADTVNSQTLPHGYYRQFYIRKD